MRHPVCYQRFDNDVSDTILHLLPTDPRWLPSERAEAIAVAGLRCLSSEVTSERFDTPVFIDAGQSFESVSCPSCGEPLDQGWWAEAMDAAHAQDFTNLAIRVPCCSAETSLNDLRYEMPQGFARFALSIRNPERELEATELRKLEGLLDTSLRLVRTRL